ncbi:MAG: hypothetical protein GY940_25550, partial [bacterium]|nr:hypothetical protein [bacterium]
MTQNYSRLFSIDVDAHLRKAASHTFGSSAHYPVELVRAALRRGAQKVAISIARNSVIVEDNGDGLDQKEIDALVRLMDPGENLVDKEEAVESLQTREGIGLLAIFAPNPTEILVENISAATTKTNRLHVRGSRFNASLDGSIKRGTRITIHRKHSDFNREKQLVEIFCRSVTRPGEIRLNNREIGGELILNRQMALHDVLPSEHTGGGQIGIPRTGSLCRLRLLDRGIPWHHLSMPPQQGLIFDAAVEYTGDAGNITRAFSDHLGEYALRLYEWLCRRYSTATIPQQDRIEELIFTHSRLTGDLSLIHQFAPFKLYNSIYSLDLPKLREKAADGTIYAIPRKKENLHYNTGGGDNKTILSLGREQADLLINHLNLPITFLSPTRKRFYRWRKFRYKLKKAGKRFLLALLPTPAGILHS